MDNISENIDPSNTDFTPEQLPKKSTWFAFVMRLLGRTFLYCLIFLVFSIIALHFSVVQTFVVRKVLQWSSPKMQFGLDVKNVYIDFWHQKIHLENVDVRDEEKNAMIFIENLEVDFSYNTLLKDGNILLNSAKIKRGNINLLARKSDGNLNIMRFIERIDSLTAPKVRNPNAPPTIFQLKKAVLQDIFFSYHDQRKPYQTDKAMDYAHLGLENLNASLDNFYLVGDTIQTQINGLHGLESKTRAKIQDLTTFFRMTRKSMEFHKLYCAFENSILKDEIFFSFKEKKDLGDFVEKVHIWANLDSTVIQPKDLEHFSASMPDYKDLWRIKGIFEGKIGDFKVKNAHLYMGKDSEIMGNIAIKNLPDVANMELLVELQEAKVTLPELNQYIQQPVVEPYLDRLGKINFKGSYVGTTNDFQTKGDFQTQLGNFQADIDMQLPKNIDFATYKMGIKTDNLDLGKLLGQEQNVGKMAIDGFVQGQGFDPHKANFKAIATIPFVDALGYRYQNLSTKSNWNSSGWQGEVFSKDKNADFTLKGAVNPFYKDKKNVGKIDIESDLKYVNLQKLGFMPQEATLKGEVSIHTEGLEMDNIIGEVDLKNAFLVYQGKGLPIEYLQMLSFKIDTTNYPQNAKLKNPYHHFDIRSEYLDLHTEGNFLFSELFTDLRTLAQEYYLSFRNEPKKILDYYKQKRHHSNRYQTQFNANFRNINPILGMFSTQMYLSKNSLIKGNFVPTNRSTSLNLETEQVIDSVFFGGNKLYNIKIDANTSKLTEKAEILAEASIISEKQQFSSLKTEKMLVNVVWSDNAIDFTAQAKQQDSQNFADLSGVLRFKEDTTLLAFNPNSKTQLLEREWIFTKNNEISFNPNNNIQVKNLALYDKQMTESKILLDGAISENPKDTLLVKIQDVDLFAFTNILSVDLKGTLNTNLKMANLLKNPIMNGDLYIENMMYGDVLIGNWDGILNYDDQNQQIHIENKLLRKGRYILDVSGNYKTQKNEKNPLDFIIEFRKTDLEILSPFVKGIVSQMGGTANGNLTVKGKFSELETNGKLAIANAKFQMDYLKTKYSNIDGNLVFTPNEITAQNVIMLDEFSNTANMDLSIVHDNFQNIFLNIGARFFNFHLLNTVAKDNSLFYGQAYGTGRLDLTGSLKNLQMNINARTQRGTKIVMPMDGYAEVGQQDYIHFIKGLVRKDSTLKKISLGGMKINFKLDVNSDAEFDIVFDKRAGDMIRAKGKGLIEMAVDTEGDFKMFGDYTIEEGKYSFTFMNITSKGFDVQKGSRINFNGSLYDSQMDIKALYTKNTSLKPLVEVETLTGVTVSELNRPYPITAVMELRGALFSPEVRLNLDLTEAKKNASNIYLRTAVIQLETRIAGDEQERNKQVFSMLILNKLTPPNEFSGLGGALGSSVSELLSNQFSNWISQLDENLELSFNVDPSALNTFSLRLAYNMLDGRLRISREGGFTNTRNQTDFASVIGDWTLEYFLTASGRYRVKAFNRVNQGFNNGITLNNSTTTTAGASFMHTATFNNVGELFKRKKKKNDDENTFTLDAVGDKLQSDSFLNFKQPEQKSKVYVAPRIIIKERMPLSHRNQENLDNIFLVKVLNEKEKEEKDKEMKENEIKDNTKKKPIKNGLTPEEEEEELEGLAKHNLLKKIEERKNESENSNTETKKTAETKKTIIKMPLKHRFAM